MDEILDEIGLSYNDLYKLHTGRYLNKDSEESDRASVSSGSLDENVKPPLFSYEEICDNLIIEPQSSTANNEDTSATNTAEEVLNELKLYITEKYCFICNNSGPYHYKGSGHYTRVRDWIHKQLSASIKINVKHCFCDICNLVLSGNSSAQKHYASDSHKKNAKSFCLVCLHGVSESRMQHHLLTKTHMKNLRKRQVNLNVYEDPIKDYKAPASKEIKITNFEQINLTDNAKDDSTKIDQGSIIAEKLKTLLTPSFCYLCEKNVGISKKKKKTHNHYSAVKHTLAVRKWLDREITKYEVSIPNYLIYCEDCLLVLGGTKEDLNHYETTSHKLQKDPFYSIGEVRGVSTKKHRENENTSHTSWPKKLANLITLYECKLCCVNLETTDKANFHYNSASHNMKVRNWIEHFNQFGEDPTENSKKFPCTFCHSRFSSEQELKDHQDVHFPSLGSIVGNTYKKSRNINSSTTSVKGKKEETASDVKKDSNPITTFQELISYNKGREDRSNHSKLNLTLERSVEQDEYRKFTEGIKMEIIKLFRAVYVLKTLPLNKSLPILKELNKKLMDASRKYKDLNNIKATHTASKNSGDIKKMVSSSPIASSNDVPTLTVTPNNDCGIFNEGTRIKRKLSMEVQRLNMVINNKSKIPVDMAYTYVELLNQILEASMIGRPCELNMKDIFKTDNRLPVTSNPQKKLLDGLYKLNNILFDCRYKNEERALDLITQFNVQLETFLQRQENNTYSFLSF